MSALAATLTDPANVFSALIALLAFFTIVTLAKPMFAGDKMAKRMKAVGERREELRRKSRQQLQRDNPNSSAGIRHQDEGLYKKVVDSLNLAKLLEDPKVVDKLAQAGYRGPKPVSTFYFFRFALPFLFLAFAGFYLFVVSPFQLPTISKFTFVGIAFIIGFYMPNIWVSNLISKRRQSIVRAFPDALDLLLICVESGMSIEAAIQKVSAEVGASSIELAEEMTLLTAELSYLPERRMAYEGLAKRVQYPGVKAVMTAMIQAERYGTPLGTALRVMAKENRDMRLSAAEKKAASLPAKLTVPMILFFLPVLFVVILGPAIIRVSAIM